MDLKTVKLNRGSGKMSQFPKKVEYLFNYNVTLMKKTTTRSHYVMILYCYPVPLQKKTFNMIL